MEHCIDQTGRYPQVAFHGTGRRIAHPDAQFASLGSVFWCGQTAPGAITDPCKHLTGFFGVDLTLF